MTWSARSRWVAYGIAGLGTLAAMRWVDEASMADATVVAPAAPRPATRAAPDQRQHDEAQVRLDWLARAPMGEVKGDPFGAPPPDPAPATLREPPPAPPPVPQAPPLPFTYLGKWIEDGRTTVFLGRGGQPVAVRGVGRLDGTYTVEAMDDKQIVLKYLPLGTLQSLSLGPPAAGTKVEARLAAAPSESSEGTQEESN